MQNSEIRVVRFLQETPVFINPSITMSFRLVHNMINCLTRGRRRMTRSIQSGLVLDVIDGCFCNTCAVHEHELYARILYPDKVLLITIFDVDN